MKYSLKHGRKTAMLVVVLITVILFGSFFYVITHGHHHCTEKDCQVCAEIQFCITSFQLLSEAFGAGAVIIFAYICLKKIILPYVSGLFLCPVSLVRLKVRLDN